jgi:hypothetical protein
VSYAIHRPRLSLVPILGFVVLFAAIVWVGSFPKGFLAIAGAITAWNLWRASTVIAVGRSGVRLGGRNPTTLVPWSSIREVVLWNAGPAGLGGGEPEVGLRLRPDAPLPDSMGSLIQDPAHPDEVPPELRRTVRGLDRARLEAAVQANGGVPVVNG